MGNNNEHKHEKNYEYKTAKKIQIQNETQINIKHDNKTHPMKKMKIKCEIQMKI